jgi:hypothetical protein
MIRFICRGPRLSEKFDEASLKKIENLAKEVKDPKSDEVKAISLHKLSRFMDIASIGHFISRGWDPDVLHTGCGHPRDNALERALGEREKKIANFSKEEQDEIRNLVPLEVPCNKCGAIGKFFTSNKELK